MDLRIITGFYKNRNIKFNKNLGIRPTLARARTVIFDTISHKIPSEFTFLDCFAGSGIMGIESLSRGAKKVVFFDIDTKILKNINENLKNMPKIPGQYSTIKTSALHPPDGNPVNVIFLDPPYEKYYIIPDVIKKLRQHGWIDYNTIIIIEYSCKDKVSLNNDFLLFKDVKISKSIIQFFMLRDPSENETKEETTNENDLIYEDENFTEQIDNE